MQFRYVFGGWDYDWQHVRNGLERHGIVHAEIVSIELTGDWASVDVTRRHGTSSAVMRCLNVNVGCLANICRAIL